MGSKIEALKLGRTQGIVQTYEFDVFEVWKKRGKILDAYYEIPLKHAKTLKKALRSRFLIPAQIH